MYEEYNSEDNPSSLTNCTSIAHQCLSTLQPPILCDFSMRLRPPSNR